MSIVRSTIPAIQSVIVRKRVPDATPPPEPKVEFEVEFELSALSLGKDFHSALSTQLGLMGSFVASDVRRCLAIDVTNGKPAQRASKTNLMMPFEDPIIMYSVLKAVDRNLRIAVIGTTNQTYYAVCKENSGYYFITCQSSVDLKESVVNLYSNSLNKGSSVFNRTVDPIPGLFTGLFKCLPHDLSISQFTVRSFSDTPVSVRVYIDSRNPKNNMISVSGWVHHLDLDVYPSEQIQRGYFGRPQIKAE